MRTVSRVANPQEEDMKLPKIILGLAVALIAAPLAFASSPTLDPGLPK